MELKDIKPEHWYLVRARDMCGGLEAVKVMQVAGDEIIVYCTHSCYRVVGKLQHLDDFVAEYAPPTPKWWQFWQWGT